MIEVELSWDDIKFDTFLKEELTQLNLFHEQVLQIFDSHFIKNGSFNSFFTLNYDNGERNGEGTLLGPDESEIRSILLPLRPLILSNDKDNIRIERILRILKDRAANDKTQSYLKIITRNYHNRDSGSAIRGKKGEYTKEKIFELWVNGYYFHKDRAKREELDDLAGSMPFMKPALKYLLLDVMIDSCEWAKLIDDILVNSNILKGDPA